MNYSSKLSKGLLSDFSVPLCSTSRNGMKQLDSLSTGKRRLSVGLRVQQRARLVRWESQRNETIPIEIIFAGEGGANPEDYA
jgi:hypothetical protein